MSEHRETDRAGDVPWERRANKSASLPPGDAAAEPLTFAVVGIGASAGGLEAFRSLLAALPPDTGMAYVVVQHLSPEHPTILAKTLTRFTSMPVIEIENGTQLAPNRVYVMPSNAEVLLSRGGLRLVPRPPPPGGRLPIDGLFRSLAAGLHSRAIGVVLSGMGADGTGGLKEIKAEGGLTFAQTPASAQFSGMPESASAAGVVDRVLPPDQIAAELARLSQHPTFHDSKGATPRPSESAGGDPVSKAPRLREELAATKQYLEAMIEQHQTSGDELATLNEELTAANQELQSTNAELEIAKEELQSANEELTTLNDSLRSRNSDLDQLANDLSNVLESVEIPIVIVDAERRIRRFTSGARSLLVLGPSDLGRPIDEIKLNIDVPDLDRRIADVMQQARQGEWEVQSAGGRWFRMRIQPHTATERGLDGALLSFVDIDALEQTLRDAQSARDYARAIVESVQVPVLVVDDHHRVVSSNPAFGRVLGAGARLGVGEDLFARSGRAWDLEPLRRAVDDVLAGRSAQPPIEVHRDLPGLGKRTFAVTVRSVAWAGGRTSALLAFEDLTEQRRLAEERTARTVAERSSRTKDLFLSTLSHELRTPLSTVLMQAQALQHARGTDPKVGHASAAIERAAMMQKRLIDDLLDISRLVSGKLQLDQHAVDLAAIVEGAVEDARPPAAAKAIALNATTAPGVTLVYADPARMQQVVSNLLSNAIKFTPRDGSVSVTVERSAAEARVTVQDTGVGVPPEFLSLLFDRFTQADSSATRAHGGLGVGLAIVKHLVDLHGGSVGADSAGHGHGATFWVTLPLVETRTPE